MSSLFLFSIYTGARGVTCSALRLMDIQSLTVQNENYLLRLNLREFKGSSYQDHPETFESQAKSDKSIDFINWLHSHLLKQFKLDLSQFQNWKLSNEEKNLFIWPQISTHHKSVFLNKRCTTHELTYYLQKCAFLAGFPLKLFSFHSLRCGFISSAVIASMMRNQVDSVYLNTSLIAKWVHKENSQLGYIKNTLHKIILCNNVVMAEDNVLNTGSIDSKAFHSLEIIQNRWPIDTNYKSMQFHVNSHTFFDLLNDKESNSKYMHNFWRKTKQQQMNFWKQWHNFLQENGKNLTSADEIIFLYDCLNDYTNPNYEIEYNKLENLFIAFAKSFIKIYCFEEKLLKSEKIVNAEIKSGFLLDNNALESEIDETDYNIHSDNEDEELSQALSCHHLLLH